MPFQTIFYIKKTGKVLTVSPNHYISKSKQKEKLFPGYTHDQIGVYYLDGDEPLDPGSITIQCSGSFGNRVVLDATGGVFNLKRTTARQKEICDRAEAIIYEAEGGLGDHLMEAAACLEFKIRNPQKWVGLSINLNHKGVLIDVEGLDRISSGILTSQAPAGAVKVSGRTEYMTDPRGIGYGKASLYGSRLGLESVQRIIKLKKNPELFERGKKILNDFYHEEERKLIGIQFRSGSGNGKSWQWERVADLIDHVYDTTEWEACVFGRKWEYPIKRERGINLTGDRLWEETYAVMLHCDAIVCIDSGVLHLARAIGKPYVCLWGGSTPEYILGEALGKWDIQLDLPCKEKLCMDCPDGRPICMEQIKAEYVMLELKKILNPKGEKSEKRSRPRTVDKEQRICKNMPR